MKPDSLEPPRWTRRRWLVTVFWVFALQAGLAFALGRRAQPPPERAGFRTVIQLAVDAKQVAQLTGQLGLDDPLLLALPNLRGFSGPAWLQFSPLEYQPAESPEPPHSLALAAAELGSGFTHFVATNRVAPLLVANKPLPALIRYEPRFPTEMVRAESSLQLQGELSGRVLSEPIHLRSWAASDILSNSVVQVGVDEDGMTFSPVLLAESGSAEADLHALRLASNARFMPLSRRGRAQSGSAGFIWGRMVFRWHTVTGPLTNPAPVSP